MNATPFGNTGFNFGFELKPKSTKIKDFLKSLVLTTVFFLALILASQAYAGNVTLSVVVNQSFTLDVSNINNFSTITPGTPVYATTTLAVTTNDSAGWFVFLSGDNKNALNNNLQTGTPPATSTQIIDQTEWAATSSPATTTPFNAVGVGSFVNGGN